MPNHISGPSRTGEELAIAIRKALDDASVSPSSVDFISAHGTATQYNDDMEARAFALAGLSPVPANSLKGYFGHTLGAAGLVESIVSIHSMKGNVMIPTLGFQEPGVPVEMNICDRLQQAEVNHCLKTASGFGGCNAALVFSKNTAP
jgi:3-oxoacyl-[acyl-carrier-protein] synthase-1